MLRGEEGLDRHRPRPRHGASGGVSRTGNTSRRPRADARESWSSRGAPSSRRAGPRSSETRPSSSRRARGARPSQLRSSCLWTPGSPRPWGSQTVHAAWTAAHLRDPESLERDTHQVDPGRRRLGKREAAPRLVRTLPPERAARVRGLADHGPQTAPRRTFALGENSRRPRTAAPTLDCVAPRAGFEPATRRLEGILKRTKIPKNDASLHENAFHGPHRLLQGVTSNVTTPPRRHLTWTGKLAQSRDYFGPIPSGRSCGRRSLSTGRLRRL